MAGKNARQKTGEKSFSPIPYLPSFNDAWKLSAFWQPSYPVQAPSDAWNPSKYDYRPPIDERRADDRESRSKGNYQLRKRAAYIVEWALNNRRRIETRPREVMGSTLGYVYPGYLSSPIVISDELKGHKKFEVILHERLHAEFPGKDGAYDSEEINNRRMTEQLLSENGIDYSSHRDSRSRMA